jgi:hypothetical protein
MAHLKQSDFSALAKILEDPAVVAAAQLHADEDVAGLSLRVREALDGIATPAVREAAQEQFQNDECEIDEDAGTSESDKGIWVQAWVWVAFPDCQLCDGIGHEPDDEDAKCIDCGGSGKGTIG